jgi:hypothetical protein
VKTVGQLGEGDRVAGHAGHPQAGVLPVDDQVAGVDLELLGGPGLGDVDELQHALADRRAALLQAAGAPRAAAPRDQVGVSPPDRDLLDGDAELVAGEHRPHRRVPLTVR